MCRSLTPTREEKLSQRRASGRIPPRFPVINSFAVIKTPERLGKVGLLMSCDTFRGFVYPKKKWGVTAAQCRGRTAEEDWGGRVARQEAAVAVAVAE